MKASEVLSKYAAGERNFQGEKLRGQSFKGQDLSGADFSGADLRGTNFKHANLQGVDFTEAKAGLEKRREAFLLVISFLASALTGLCSLIIVGLVSSLFDYSDFGKLYIGLFSFIFLVIFLIVTFRKDLADGTSAKAVDGELAVAGVGAVAVAGITAGNVAGAVILAVAVAVAGAGAVAVAVAVAVAGAVAEAVAGTVAGAFAFAFAFAVVGAAAGAGNSLGTGVDVVAGSVALIFLVEPLIIAGQVGLTGLT